MKLVYIFPALFIITFGCGQNNKGNNKESSMEVTTEAPIAKKNDNIPTKHIYDIKSAKITFNYTSIAEKGIETLFFDDYGEVAVLVVDKKNKFGHTLQTTIWKDKKSTIIDHEKKIVSKSVLRPKSTEAPSIAEIDDKTRNNIGYQKLATETVAGKPCEVWFNAKQNFKYCIWKKIGLKEILGTSIQKEATEVEEISEIPTSVMEIPKDYKQ